MMDPCWTPAAAGEATTAHTCCTVRLTFAPALPCRAVPCRAVLCPRPPFRPYRPYSGVEQALLLAWATYVHKATAADELQPWAMAPYVEAVLQQPRSQFMVQVGGRAGWGGGRGGEQWCSCAQADASNSIGGCPTDMCYT